MFISSMWVNDIRTMRRMALIYRGLWINIIFNFNKHNATLKRTWKRRARTHGRAYHAIFTTSSRSLWHRVVFAKAVYHTIYTLCRSSDRALIFHRCPILGSWFLSSQFPVPFLKKNLLATALLTAYLIRARCLNKNHRLSLPNLSCMTRKRYNRPNIFYFY